MQVGCLGIPQVAKQLIERAGIDLSHGGLFLRNCW
jgi:hypothetical protein